MHVEREQPSCPTDYGPLAPISTCLRSSRVIVIAFLMLYNHAHILMHTRDTSGTLVNCICPSDAAELSSWINYYGNCLPGQPTVYTLTSSISMKEAISRVVGRLLRNSMYRTIPALQGQLPLDKLVCEKAQCATKMETYA